jgi:hypothetical protein
VIVVGCLSCQDDEGQGNAILRSVGIGCVGMLEKEGSVNIVLGMSN